MTMTLIANKTPDAYRKLKFPILNNMSFCITPSSTSVLSATILPAPVIACIVSLVIAAMKPTVRPATAPLALMRLQNRPSKNTAVIGGAR